MRKKQDSPSPQELEHIAEPLRGLAYPLDALHASERNPRLHSERNIQAIMASIEEFGQDQPIVARQNGEIIKGHGRWEALRRLGYRYGAVVFVDDGALEALRRGVADNRAAELAHWDWDLLSDVLKYLEEEGGGLREEWWNEKELEALVSAPMGIIPTERPLPIIYRVELQEWEEALEFEAEAKRRGWKVKRVSR